MKTALLLLAIYFVLPAPAQQLPLGKILVAAQKERGRDVIYLVNSDGSDPVFITDGSVPSASPGGRYITYIIPEHADNTGSIWIMDLRTKQAKRLYGLNVCYPRWSPDGRHIAFEYVAYKRSGIYLMDTNGNNVLELVSDARNPAWSPDGKYIAYSNGYDIYSMNINNKQTRRLTNTRELKEKFPAWSQDGRYIAFITQGQDTDNIEIIDLKSNKKKVLAQCMCSHISWTGNGMILYEYRSDRLTNTQIAVIDPATKTTRTITVCDKDLWWPEWVK